MKKYLLPLLCAVVVNSAIAQDSEAERYKIEKMQIDSLLSLITPSTADSTKARYYNWVSQLSYNPDTTIKYAQMSLDLCDDTCYARIADNYYYMAWGCYTKDDYVSTVPYAHKSIDYYLKDGDDYSIANVYQLLGINYDEMGKSDSVFIYLGKALELYTNNRDTAEVSTVLTILGSVYNNSGFKQSAKRHYKRALHLDSLMNDYPKMGEDLMLRGECEDNDSIALPYYKKALSILDTLPPDDFYSYGIKISAYKYLANRYIGLAQKTSNKAYADSCFMFLKKMGTYELDNNQYRNYIETQQVNADYLVFIGKGNEALKNLLDCQQYFKPSWGQKIYADYYKKLADIYEKLGDYKNALDIFKKYQECKAAMVTDSTISQMVEFRTKATLDHKYAQFKQKRQEQRYKIVMILAWLGGLGLLVLVVYYIIRMIKIKRNVNDAFIQQNEILTDQQSEIQSQRDVIMRQTQDVEYINNQLYDQLTYAQRIQQAANSSQSKMDKVFAENFVFYRPRDFVSGDFYRVAQRGKYSVLMVGDCTGHGIQGAFLSMLAISALNDICDTEDEVANPGEVLNSLHRFFKNSLGKAQKHHADDAVEISVLCFDFAAKELRYASASQNVLLLRRGEVIKLKGDRKPVGRLLENDKFSSFTMPIEKDDVFYSYSDGIPDQPGGPTNERLGKKFLLKHLEEFLIENYSKPLNEQLKLFDKRMTEWRNGRQQVDDMTLVGVRV